MQEIKIYISTGMKGVMHTLRRQIFTSHLGIKDSYIKTLYKDEKESIEEAKRFSSRTGQTFAGIWSSPFNERLKKALTIEIEDLEIILKQTKKRNGFYGSPSDKFFTIWKVEKEYLKSIGFSLFKSKETGKFIIYLKTIEKTTEIKSVNYEKIFKKIKKQKEKSEYFGTIGEKTEIVAIFENEQSYMGYDYYSNECLKYISYLRTEDGNVIKYFNKIKLKETNENGSNKCPEKGDKIKFRATVKKHEEYQYEKQTVIKRASKAVLL